MTPPKGAAETGIKVVRHEQRQRFEAWDGDRVTGYTEYILAQDMVVFTHTEVDQATKAKGSVQRLRARCVAVSGEAAISAHPPSLFIRS